MNIENGHVETLKHLNLPEILRSYGYDLKQKSPTSFMMLCPFHDDKNPSLSLSLKGDRWLWNCFGCHESGSAVHFVMKKENLSFQEAYLKFCSPTGVGHPVPAINPLELLRTVVEFYHKSFFEDKRGVEYLRGRGIKSEEVFRSFKLGFVSGSLKKILSPKSEAFKTLKEIGILNEEGNECFYNSVVVPLFDEDQNPVGLYGRNVSRQQHLYLKGPHKGLMNREGAKGTEKIILTESVIDALSLYELGIRNVIPCYGTGGFTEHHAKLLTKEKIKEVEISFDNDAAGIRGVKDLAGKLKTLGVRVTSVKLPEDVKDANDFLISGKTKEDFKALERVILSPPQAGEGSKNQILRSRFALAQNDGYEVLHDKDAITLKVSGREYRLRVTDQEFTSHLRVNIKLAVGDKTHIDTLNLYSQRQRSVYKRRLSKEFSLPQDEIEKDLCRMIEEIESATKTSADSSTIEKPMSVEEKEEALRTLKNPKLIEEIIEDLSKIGCVGEDTSKLLGYLVTLSRRLELPLSMIIVSQSAAGKSNLADTLESIVPKEECMHLSRITPQALYYMEKDALKRKVLIIEEKEGSDAADYSIRVLQSKQVLRLAVPLKDPQTGRIKTTTFEVEGPVVVIETTTKTDHNPENTSRCFVVYMDESEEQTKRIHAFQRKQKTLAGTKDKKEAEHLRAKHRNIQKLLRPLVVNIPFVDQIKFPSKWMRTRRDYPKFLNLIEAVSFLHQYQREIKKDEEGTEYIEATLEDYKTAYEISKNIFGDSLSELQKPQADFFDQIKTLLQEKKQSRFTRREVREYTGLPDHLVRRCLETLVSLEYLNLAEGKNGVRYEYQINPYPVEAREIIEGLTIPEELASATRASADRLAPNLATTLREPCSKVKSFKLNGITSPCNLAGKA